MKRMVVTPLVVALAVAGALAPGGPAGAQARPTVPPIGSPDRRAIMDTVRGPVEARIRRPVVFRVQDPAQDFHVQDGWAFLQAQVRQANGAPLGKDVYRRLAWEGQYDSSDVVMVLLRRRAGHWHLVGYALFPTDVAWEGWDRRYHAPSAIFPRYGRPGR